MWQSASPGTTPMEFSVWGFLKDAVYKTKVKFNNITELRQKVTNAFQTIYAYQLQNAWRELKYYLKTIESDKWRTSRENVIVKLLL